MMTEIFCASLLRLLNIFWELNNHFANSSKGKQYPILKYNPSCELKRSDPCFNLVLAIFTYKKSTKLAHPEFADHVY